MSDHPAPPPVTPSPLTEFFWEGANHGELRIQRCQACGTYIHLPRPVCRRCLSFDLRGEAVSGRATLYTYTVTMKAFHPFFAERVPYVIATVELAEQPGLMLMSNLVDVAEADISIGMDLTVDFEVLSAELTIPVFRAAAASASRTAGVAS
jgi:uncharacterized OB-fold protein